MDTKNNTGVENSGHWNSGYLNSGNRNSGYLNSGHRNSGHRNSGSWNSGNWNSGDLNSGDLNSGHWNSGYLNSGHRNSGHFNTNSPDKVRIFNTWIDMSHDEFNEKHNIYMDIPLNRWIEKDDMTDTEKKEVKGWETMGGYLKTLPFKEACQIWWSENPSRHNDFFSLPAFNADIFKEITGIDVKQDDEVEKAIKLLTEKGRIKDGKVIV
jgi:hypothetical protein